MHHYLAMEFYNRSKQIGIKKTLQQTVAYIDKISSQINKNQLSNGHIHFGQIKHNPLVSIIAVNYNGSKDLPIFLESVSRQSYRNFELIIVDNGSKDNSIEIINHYQKIFKSLCVIKSEQNLGFAAGNNYALPYCNGELLCLLNIDTKVDKEWLKELVDALSVDSSCAAVASKTLFFERFQDIEFTSTDNFSLEIDTLVESLKYKKYFIRHGKSNKNLISSQNNKIIISLPIQKTPINFICFKSTKKTSSINCKIGKNQSQFFTFADRELRLNINYTQDDVIDSSYIINNAGSMTYNNMPGDRGIGEYDIGQYDSKSYVDFMCGVSVLLRRTAILDRKIFVSEFFAYYEDSELSRWLTSQGYKILYAPRSIVYHRHSATSSEGSALWHLLVSRSQKIYTYNGNVSKLKKDIYHCEEEFKKHVNRDIYSAINSFSNKLITRLKEDNALVEKLKPIGIYNSYWNTRGGGESHALSFATVLQRYETVYLISETNFNIKELEDYYHLDLSNCRKIVEPLVNVSLTKKFNIFINSTYRSNLLSQAKKSYYIVSFPHRNPDKDFLSSYTFLYNSDYTKKWALKYWGNTHKGEIVYPLGMIHMISNQNHTITEKEKIILSVGRFFKHEHSKNQHIIAQAYKTIVSNNPFYKEWKLVLVGSLNQNTIDDIEYFHFVESLLQGLNHKIIINANKETLEEYYQSASIYIHATGFERNHNLEPEKFEHFGITPVEAMKYGCYPIVYKYGGPSDLLNTLGIGLTFGTLSELCSLLVDTINNYDKNMEKIVKQKIDKYLTENQFDKKIIEILLLPHASAQ